MGKKLQEAPVDANASASICCGPCPSGRYCWSMHDDPVFPGHNALLHSGHGDRDEAPIMNLYLLLAESSLSSDYS